MNWSNYHTHSNYCDGQAEPEAYVRSAIASHMRAIGFSSHAPVPFENTWSMAYDKMNHYRQSICELKEKYAGKIEVHLSLEADYIPGITTPVAEFRRRLQPDYLIGGIHLVKPPKDREGLWFIDGPEEGYEAGLNRLFDGDIRLAVTTFYNQTRDLLVNHRPDIIAHFDKVKMYNRDQYFLESEDWYQALIDQTLDVIEQQQVIVEVNTRGLYVGKSDALYPCVEVLEKMVRRQIPVVISADAHEPEQVCLLFEETWKTLQAIGYKKLMQLTEGSWIQVAV